MRFPRPALAHDLAAKLLDPGPLDKGLRSGLFLSAPRRTGKTTFLVSELMPQLKKNGAVAIYVDLAGHGGQNPAVLVKNAVEKSWSELEKPGAATMRQIKRVGGLVLGAAGSRLGLKFDEMALKNGPTLPEALTALVDLAKADVVLIVDEVQQATSSEGGLQLLQALKAARDAINTRPNTPGHFLFIGTGSHHARVAELSSRRTQAFHGAVTMEFPPLGDDFVAHLMDQLQPDLGDKAPSLPAAIAAFNTLGHRPEELLQATRLLRRNLPAGARADEHLPTIAATLSAAAAAAELERLRRLGPLAEAVFGRVCACALSDGPGTGRNGASLRLFSAPAAAAYAQALGRVVRVDEIQPVVNALLAESLLVRRGHGDYRVSDVQVQQAWLERQTPALPTSKPASKPTAKPATKSASKPKPQPKRASASPLKPSAQTARPSPQKRSVGTGGRRAAPTA